MGSMRQRSSGSWRIKAYVGRDPTTQRKRYVERTVKGTKSEAKTALAKLVTEVSEGRVANSGAATFDELFDRWLELKEHQLDPRTHDGYRWIIERYLSKAIGSMKISRLRTADLDHLYATLLRSGGRNGKPLSPATVRQCHNVMRQSLAQARRWGMLAVNPAEDATPPRKVHKEIVPPSPDDVLALLRGAMEWDPDFGVYLRLLAATGCRRSEALALRWRDLEPASDGQATLTISRSIGQSTSGIEEKDTKTHQGRRVILDAGTVAILEEHRRRWEERAATADAKITQGVPALLHRARRECSRGGPTSPPTASTSSVGSSGSRASAYTTSATSWPPASVRRELRSPPFRTDSVTGTGRRH